jgi:hypothetical protein
MKILAKGKNQYAKLMKITKSYNENKRINMNI